MAQDTEEALDLGAYSQLQIDCRVERVGTGTAGGRVNLQHAAINENAAYRDLANASWVVDSTATGGFVSVTNFLRFLRWATDTNVAGQPIAIIDVVAKE